MIYIDIDLSHHDLITKVKEVIPGDICLTMQISVPVDASWSSPDMAKGGETMKSLIRTIQASIHLAPVVLCLGFNAAMAQDLVKLMPDDVKVLIDNDRVRVLDVHHKPGAQEPMHSHPAYVAVYMGSTRVRVTTPEGKSTEKDRKFGEVSWSEGVTHAVDNVGTSDQHTIVIELKR
jgi:quercetin dioxygenase-like cupin family protein